MVINMIIKVVINMVNSMVISMVINMVIVCTCLHTILLFELDKFYVLVWKLDLKGYNSGAVEVSASIIII